MLKKLYLDNGANVKIFKDLHSKCEFIVSPYDHESSRRKDIKWTLGNHSEVHWDDCNWPWEDDNQAWDDHVGSQHLVEIYAIIGVDPQNRRDGLHLDSAFKSNCVAFLTSDKKDIWQNREALQNLLGYRIFHPISELNELKQFICN